MWLDIHAGSATCLVLIILWKFLRRVLGYYSEGVIHSRNLIIFGQGLNKSHPHIYPVLDSILNDNRITLKLHLKTF